jgi:hypothetical protein
MHLSFFVGRGEFAKADYIGRGSLCFFGVLAGEF